MELTTIAVRKRLRKTLRSYRKSGTRKQHQRWAAPRQRHFIVTPKQSLLGILIHE